MLYLAWTESDADILPYGLDDACGGDKFACIIAVGAAQVGEDEFLLVAHLFEVAVVLFELGHLGGVEPVVEAFAIEFVGLGIEAVVGDGVGVIY